jgi:serpin B
MDFLLKLGLLCFTLLNTVAATAQESNMPTETTESSNAEGEYGNLVVSSNSLAFDIYKRLTTSQDENLIFSPYSLMTALGMVYTGADGSTQSQMARILRFPLNVETLANNFGALAEKLNHLAKRSGEFFSLNISNGLWVQRGHTILPEFKNLIVKDYRGIVKEADFSTQPEAVRVDINNWIKDRTDGKIQTLFSQGQIQRDSRMLLISTIYMKGKWQLPFNSALTRQTPFFPDSAKSITVQMMSTTGTFSSTKGSDYTLLELPYDMREVSKDLNVSMLILLPSETHGLAALEKHLDANELQASIRELKGKKMSVSIPKFNVVSSLTLNEVFAQMGLISPFSNDADFGRIDGTQELKISQIVQKTYIAVDEKGTEAASATGAVMTAKAFVPGTPEIFLADHPFMYFIVDKLSGAILFMGRVMDPSE